NVQFFPAFTLSQGPPAFIFPTIPSNGQLPLGGPPIQDASGHFISLGNNIQPRIRPTVQRLPTLDAWNATVQHQLTNTITVEAAYVGNKATHVFAGNGPTIDANPVPLGPGTAIVTTAGVTPNFQPTVPADQRRP